MSDLLLISTGYDQSIFRTMVFKRLQSDEMEIDGKTYIVTNSCN